MFTIAITALADSHQPTAQLPQPSHIAWGPVLPQSAITFKAGYEGVVTTMQPRDDRLARLSVNVKLISCSRADEQPQREGWWAHYEYTTAES